MFTKAREIASWYQSPGPAGIGFAQYASTGTVTPELWSNIRTTEREAELKEGADYADEWAADMAKLRELLAEDGITEPADED